MKITAIILILLALHVSLAVSASSKTKTTASKTSTITTSNGTMGLPPRNNTNNGTMGPPPGNGTNGTLPMDPPPAKNDTNSSSSSSRLLTTLDEESEASLLPDGFYDIAEKDPSKKNDDTVSEEELRDGLPPMERKGRPLDMPPPKPRGRKELPKMRGSGNFRGSN